MNKKCTSPLWSQADLVVVDAVVGGMRQANDAFDLAYRQAATWDELETNITATIEALLRVRSIVRGDRTAAAVRALRDA